ncbi:hypothetical protein BCR39DRAFT_58188 [Naematelia encephala]|uniref:Citrate transporter-like domain-containing protein n=1 Tax=Naematelia encephala TaxID=71784 RepID=A0A1Y2BBJ6_9TREE|nr:hypothetical protein BCR39DRAFT_58188 [Naematelia encephala]
MVQQQQQLVGSDRSIDARSIVTLIVFFIVNALVIYPIYIPIPYFISRSCKIILLRLDLYPSDSTPTTTTTQDGINDIEKKKKKKKKDTIVESDHWRFPLDLRTIPVIGVLLLLASTCIPGSVVRDGIVGTDGVRPYDILTLFISFAYISLSLDCTGLLRYLAYLVAARSSTSGSTLYTAFYCFFVLTGLIVGNDPLVLSGTPFLAYFTSHASISPPTAYLFTHFQVANLVSALLVSSNPTNLVLTSAFGLSFLRYSAWTALPTVAAIVVLYPILRYGLFRGDQWIPGNIQAPEVDPKSALKDAWGGIFGAGLFVVTIVLLVGLSAGSKLDGVEGVWTVTAPAAIIMLIRDCWRDVVVRRRERDDVKDSKSRRSGGIAATEVESTDKTDRRVVDGGDSAEANAPLQATETQESDNDGTLIGPSGSRTPNTTQGGHIIDPESPSRSLVFQNRHTEVIPSRSKSATPVNVDGSPSPPMEATALTPADELSTVIPSLFQPLARLFPTPMLIITRLPLPLVPFGFSMFILVSSLQYTGWIRVFAIWWGAWIEVSGVAGSIWLMGTISVIGCDIFGTNIGATVLLSRVLQQWQADNGGDVSNRTLYGAVFALAVGSNFGAYSFVFSGSLAGLLWRGMLHQRGIRIGLKQFAKWNTVPLVVTMIVGCLVVAGEVCVMYDT